MVDMINAHADRCAVTHGRCDRLSTAGIDKREWHGRDVLSLARAGLVDSLVDRDGGLWRCSPILS